MINTNYKKSYKSRQVLQQDTNYVEIKNHEFFSLFANTADGLWEFLLLF